MSTVLAILSDVYNINFSLYKSYAVNISEFKAQY